MKKEIKKKSCECKHICRDCLYIVEYGEEPGPEKLSEPQCTKYPIKNTNCVTGETTTAFKMCFLINTDGDCKKYKLNQPDADKKKLIKMLGRFKRVYHPMNWAGRESIEGCLINDLLRVLDGRDSILIKLFNDSDDCNPYEEIVIAKDDLYCRTKRIKEKK